MITTLLLQGFIFHYLNDFFIFFEKNEQLKIFLKNLMVFLVS